MKLTYPMAQCYVCEKPATRRDKEYDPPAFYVCNSNRCLMKIIKQRLECYVEPVGDNGPTFRSGY